MSCRLLRPAAGTARRFVHAALLRLTLVICAGVFRQGLDGGVRCGAENGAEPDALWAGQWQSGSAARTRKGGGEGGRE